MLLENMSSKPWYGLRLSGNRNVMSPRNLNFYKDISTSNHLVDTCSNGNAMLMEFDPSRGQSR